jgi:CHAT domain-containing protein
MKSRKAHLSIVSIALVISVAVGQETHPAAPEADPFAAPQLRKLLEMSTKPPVLRDLSGNDEQSRKIIEEMRKASDTGTEQPNPESTWRVTQMMVDYMYAPARERQQLARGEMQAAQYRRDPVGEALAYRMIAMAELEFDMTPADGAYRFGTPYGPLQKEVKWREAAEAWRRAGDGPGRMEALCASGRYRAAQALGRLETKRPLAAGRVLNYYGTLLLSGDGNAKHGWWAVNETLDAPQMLAPMTSYPYAERDKQRAQQVAGELGFELLQEAARLLTERAPDSLEMCAVAYNLGAARLAHGELAEADRHLTRALHVAERMTPQSGEALATILHSLTELADRQGDAARAQSLRARAASPPADARPSWYFLAKLKQPKAFLVAGNALTEAPGRATRPRRAGTVAPPPAAPGAVPSRALRVVKLKHDGSDFDQRVTLENYLDPDDCLRKYEFTSVAGAPHVLPPPPEFDYTQYSWMTPEAVAGRSPENQRPYDEVMTEFVQKEEEAHRSRMQESDASTRRVMGKLDESTQEAMEITDPSPKRRRRHEIGGEQSAANDTTPNSVDKPAPPSDPWQAGRQGIQAAELSALEEDESLLKFEQTRLRHRDYFVGAGPLTEFQRIQRHSALSRVVRDLIARRNLGEVFRLTEAERDDLMRDYLVERALFFESDGLRLSPEDRRALSLIYTFMQESSERRLAEIFERATVVARRFAATLKSPGTSDARITQSVEEYLAADSEVAKALGEINQLFLRRYELFGKMAGRRATRPTPYAVLEGARGSLAADDVYISFLVGRNRTHILLTRRTGTPKAWSLALPRQALYDQVIRFRDDVSGGADLDEVTQAGRKLHALLFPPELRQALLGARRVIISPDSFLWDLPFAALVVNDAGAPRFLGTEKSLTYAQSLSLLRGAPSADAIAEVPARDVVVLGISQFAADKIRPAFGKGGMQLDPLPNAKNEAVAIAGLYGVSPLLDEGATEGALRQRAASAAVLHVATHGYSSSDTGMSSGLVFSLAGRESGPTDDGLLRAWEVLSQVRLRADLVVLSACETARGPGGYGDGFGRLVRSLQAAGARAVVASQWKVADDSTKVLMETFHRQLRQGFNKDDALREAMKALQTEPHTAHPYYWAPFVLTGSPAALNPAVRE